MPGPGRVRVYRYRDLADAPIDLFNADGDPKGGNEKLTATTMNDPGNARRFANELLEPKKVYVVGRLGTHEPMHSPAAALVCADTRVPGPLPAHFSPGADAEGGAPLALTFTVTPDPEPPAGDGAV